MLAQETRHKFSVKEYLALSDNRILPETPRTELINGEIIELSPLGFRHAKTQQLIHNFLVHHYSDKEVYQNGSIFVDDKNMVEPDIFVLPADAVVEDNYPNAGKMTMIVEVADSTTKSDLLNDGTGKLSSYAVCQVPVVWVVNVESTSIYEFSHPEDAVYKDCKIHQGASILLGLDVEISELIAK